MTGIRRIRRGVWPRWRSKPWWPYVPVRTYWPREFSGYIARDYARLIYGLGNHTRSLAKRIRAAAAARKSKYHYHRHT